jgi:hypothetical protein
MHDQIGPGAELHIFGAGESSPLPPSDLAFSARFPDGAATRIKVIEVGENQAIIETSDQTKWIMVRKSAEELQVPPGASDLPATYWSVKERAK